MAENLLTVSALRTTVEAELIRGKLQSAGIAAVLVEPEAAADGAPAGRVQVQVSQPDFERAMQLLFPIPKLNAAARQTRPPWKCPKCGEQVMGTFQQCWSCGTPRDGSTADTATPPAPQPPLGGTAPLPAAPLMPSPPAPPAATSAPPAPQIQMPSITPISAGPSATPASPLPPMPGAPFGGLPPAPHVGVPPRMMPHAGDGATETSSAPRLSVPLATSPAAGDASPFTTRPAANGESSAKGAAEPPRRLPRTTDDDELKIVVPAWDPNTTRSGRGAAARREPTDADDRAARRAWWCAVFGAACPPLLVYSIGVVLILAFSNRPLSARGSRFFYGALALNALIVAAAFALFGAWK